MPHSAAGPRIEPPVSEPIAPGTNPAAIAAPAPLDEPPVKCSRFHGIARRRPGEVEGRAAMREFMGRELAEQHPAGLVEPRDGRRVLGRDIIRADPRVAGRADAGGAVDVLQPERNAVQRPAIIAGHDLALGGPRLLPRPLGGRQQKGVELRVERFDARDQRVGQLDRGEPALFDQTRRVGDRQPMQFRRRGGRIVGHVVFLYLQRRAIDALYPRAGKTRSEELAARCNRSPPR